MREIEITKEQAQFIQEADEAAKAAAKAGQRDLLLILRATLAGHGIKDVEVLKMDTDREPPVLIVRDQPGQNGAREDDVQEAQQLAPVHGGPPMTMAEIVEAEGTL